MNNTNPSPVALAVLRRLHLDAIDWLGEDLLATSDVLGVYFSESNYPAAEVAELHALGLVSRKAGRFGGVALNGPGLDVLMAEDADADEQAARFAACGW